MTWSIDWNPTWPFLSQNATNDTWDGGPPENASEDCGETCLAMVIQYLTGVHVPPDSIKDEILGQGATGPSTLPQLSDFLLTNASTNTTQYWPLVAQNGSNGLLDRVYQYLVKGKPCIVLKNYSATIPTAHWVTPIYLDSTTVGWCDPWNGSFAESSYYDFFKLYAATKQWCFFGVERTRDTNL